MERHGLCGGAHGVSGKHRDTLITHLLQAHTNVCSGYTCMNTQKCTLMKTRRQNKMWFALCFIQLKLDRVKWFSVCLCMCVLVSVLSLRRCPNEWPHSGKGSSQITEQNRRLPAAWVANKCHHNIHRGEGGAEGTVIG